MNLSSFQPQYLHQARIFTNYNVTIRHKVETKQMSLDWVGDSAGGLGTV